MSMKFPRIFKVPGHRRFHIEPRYYDPIKEDIEQRTAHIKAEMERERSQGSSPRSLRNSFRDARERREQESIRSNIVLGILMAGMLGFVFAYLEYGNWAFLILLAIIPLYIYLKSKS